MDSTQTFDILIYLLAGGLTVSIFLYWKNNQTEIKIIKRCLWVTVLFFLVLTGLFLAFTVDITQWSSHDTEIIQDVILKVLALPYLSFFYFIFFAGILYLLRDRRNRGKNK